MASRLGLIATEAGSPSRDIEPLTNLEEELADIIIRVLDNAEYLEVDIEKAVISKHAFNHTRKTRHGGKKS